MNRKITIVGLLLLLAATINAQQLTQTIRGVVREKSTLLPMPGVNIIITSLDPQRGTVTDVDGKFKIENVPVGRHQLKASFIGYESYENLNLELTVSKQLVLDIQLDEKTEMVDEVVVRSYSKVENINQMSTVSSRTFSIEETNRFAGSMGDVSRMASSFAGVKAGNDAVNEIVIRGNSPNGLLWRLEGVDIPNPNHFGRVDGTSGPVSLLNNNVLANSDFFTGAFPADYGNALSGVFDLRMRNGNDETYEFLGQVGFNGFELGAEGPISKRKGSSFMLNYRYSTLALVKELGMNMGTGTAIPYYQDITGKLHFPLKAGSSVNVFFLGGTSHIEFVESERDTTEESSDIYGVGDQDIYSQSATSVAGVSYRQMINPSTYLKMTLASSYMYNNNSVDSISTEDRSIVVPWYRQNMVQTKQSFISYINKKYSASTRMRVGGQLELLGYDMADSIYVKDEDQFQTITQSDSSAIAVQPYVCFQHKFSPRLVMNAGVHGLYLSVSDQFALEPRLGMKWAVAKNKSLNVGYGLHAQHAPLNIYMVKHDNGDGTYAMNNTDIGFQNSHHFVVGYEQRINEKMRFKSEVYYQYIPNALVGKDSSTFSLLNYGSMTRSFPTELVNEGKGKNYGIEFTLEKFMDRGMYFLATASLYDSRYKASDSDGEMSLGIFTEESKEERNTAFNNNYVFNFIGGKEFTFKNKKPDSPKKKSITTDIKFNWSGGMRYIPVDLEASRTQMQAVYNYDRAYQEQMADYMRFDIRIGYKAMGKKITQEWALDLQNVTNRKNPFYQDYDKATQDLKVVNQLGFFPMMLYRINF